jgi:hypothetical protein
VELITYGSSLRTYTHSAHLSIHLTAAPHRSTSPQHLTAAPHRSTSPQHLHTLLCAGGYSRRKLAEAAAPLATSMPADAVASTCAGAGKATVAATSVGNTVVLQSAASAAVLTEGDVALCDGKVIVQVRGLEGGRVWPLLCGRGLWQRGGATVLWFCVGVGPS